MLSTLRTCGSAQVRTVRLVTYYSFQGKFLETYKSRWATLHPILGGLTLHPILGGLTLHPILGGLTETLNPFRWGNKSGAKVRRTRVPWPEPRRTRSSAVPTTPPRSQRAQSPCAGGSEASPTASRPGARASGSRPARSRRCPASRRPALPPRRRGRTCGVRPGVRPGRRNPLEAPSKTPGPGAYPPRRRRKGRDPGRPRPPLAARRSLLAPLRPASWGIPGRGRRAPYRRSCRITAPGPAGGGQSLAPCARRADRPRRSDRPRPTAPPRGSRAPDAVRRNTASRLSGSSVGSYPATARGNLTRTNCIVLKIRTR